MVKSVFRNNVIDQRQHHTPDADLKLTSASIPPVCQTCTRVHKAFSLWSITLMFEYLQSQLAITTQYLEVILYYIVVLWSDQVLTS
jgi:hypothetical protein